HAPARGFGVGGAAAIALAVFAAVAIVVSKILGRRDVAIEQTQAVRRRVELVSSASVLLALSREYPPTFAKLAERVVGDFADICLSDGVQPHGAIERAAAAHRVLP